MGLERWTHQQGVTFFASELRRATRMALGGLRREWLESRAQAIFLIRLTDEDSISRPSRIHTYYHVVFT